LKGEGKTREDVKLKSAEAKGEEKAYAKAVFDKEVVDIEELKRQLRRLEDADALAELRYSDFRHQQKCTSGSGSVANVGAAQSRPTVTVISAQNGVVSITSAQAASWSGIGFEVRLKLKRPPLLQLVKKGDNRILRS
jgi:hypothetical protein